MAWRVGATAAVVAVLAAAGCGPAKLNREMTVAIGEIQAQAWGFAPQPVEQKFQVEVSTDNPVNVYVIPGVDETYAMGMSAGELEQKCAAVKLDLTKGTLTATIPPKTATAVVVRPGKQRLGATGKIRVSN